MLPKTLRVVIFASPCGTLTARAIYQLTHAERVNLRQKGFEQIAHMRAPLRRLQHGWFPLAQEAYRSLIRAYSL